ncbi:hypothetical protein Cni_G11604 [Canna indica]|uniref:Uncharacterized protein n=1 Tax=Canna indica TaxID=4628 RepID=A0AAQ3K8D1_9LILI|nr:hypothetical protein Cni_G11604 [Canna indica]
MQSTSHSIMATPAAYHLALLSSLSINTAIALLLLAAMASVVISLCAAHKHSKMYPKEKYKVRSTPPTKEEKMLIVDISSKESTETEEEALWKKSIIMGERCKPLDFSGQILYDSHGNRLI